LPVPPAVSVNRNCVSGVPGMTRYAVSWFASNVSFWYIFVAVTDV
jgi:hypothetical protein